MSPRSGIRLDNAALADRLQAFAALLELGSAEPYAARAYRRAAETIRGTPVPVAELVRSGRVRDLRGIGPGIAARLTELVETGRIAELDELERELRPELIGLGRMIGVGPGRMLELGAALGVETAAEFREAALAGRLQEVRGVGPATERKPVERLQQNAGGSRARGILLPRARELVGGIAEALGGEIAGDARRWVDAPQELRVVVASSRPAEVLERFEQLPQVVAVLERSERGALGVTVDGVPVELVVAEPGRLGTELVAATGSRAYVEALGPLPEARDETALYAGIGVPFCPPELREEPFR